jgi:hypothetical protein
MDTARGAGVQNTHSGKPSRSRAGSSPLGGEPSSKELREPSDSEFKGNLDQQYRFKCMRMTIASKRIFVAVLGNLPEGSPNELRNH